MGISILYTSETRRKKMLSKSENVRFNRATTTIFMALWLIPILLISLSSQLNGAVVSSKFLVMDATKSADNVSDKLVRDINSSMPGALANKGNTVLRLDSSSPIYQRAKSKLDSTEQARMDTAYSRIKSDTTSVNEKTSAAVYLGSILEMDTAIAVDIYGLDRDSSRTQSKIILACTVMRAQTDATGKIVVKNGNITAYKTILYARGEAIKSGTGGYISDEALDQQALNNAMTDLLNQLTATSQSPIDTKNGELIPPLVFNEPKKSKDNTNLYILLGVLFVGGIAVAASSDGGGGSTTPQVNMPTPAVAVTLTQNKVNPDSTGNVRIDFRTSPALADNEIIKLHYARLEDGGSGTPSEHSIISSRGGVTSSLHLAGETKSGGGGHANASKGGGGVLTPKSRAFELYNNALASRADTPLQGQWKYNFKGNGEVTQFSYTHENLSAGRYIYYFYDKDDVLIHTDIVKVDATIIEVSNVNAISQFSAPKSVLLSWSPPALSNNVQGYKIYVLKGTVTDTGVPKQFTATSFTSDQLTTYGFTEVGNVGRGVTSYTHVLNEYETNNIFIYVVKPLIYNSDTESTYLSIGPYSPSPYVIFPSVKDVINPKVTMVQEGDNPPVMRVAWTAPPYLLALTTEQEYLENNYGYLVYYTEGELSYDTIFKIEDPIPSPWVLLNPQPEQVPYISGLTTYDHTLDNIISPFSLNTTNNYVVVGHDFGHGYTHFMPLPPYYVNKYFISGPAQLSFVNVDIEEISKVRVKWGVPTGMYTSGFYIYKKKVHRSDAEANPLTEIPLSMYVSDLSSWTLIASVGGGDRQYEDPFTNSLFEADYTYLYAVVPKYREGAMPLLYNPPYMWARTPIISTGDAQPQNFRIEYNYGTGVAKLDWAAPHNPALVDRYILYRITNLPDGVTYLTQDQWDTLMQYGTYGERTGCIMSVVYNDPGFTYSDTILDMMSVPGTIMSYVIRSAKPGSALIDAASYPVRQAGNKITTCTAEVLKDAPTKLYYSSNPNYRTSASAITGTTLSITATMGTTAAANQTIRVSLAPGVRGQLSGADAEGYVTVQLDKDGKTTIVYTADADLDSNNENTPFRPSRDSDFSKITLDIRQVGYESPIFRPSIETLSFIGEPSIIRINAALPKDVDYTTLYGPQNDTDSPNALILFSGHAVTISGTVTDRNGINVFPNTIVWVTQTYDVLTSAEARADYNDIADILGYQKKAIGPGAINNNGMFAVNDKGEIDGITFSSNNSGNYTVSVIPILINNPNYSQDLSSVTNATSGVMQDATYTKYFLTGVGGSITQASKLIRNKTFATNGWVNVSYDSNPHTMNNFTTVRVAARDDSGKFVLPGVPYRADTTNSNLTTAKSSNLATASTVKDGFLTFGSDSATSLTITTNRVIAWPTIREASLSSTLRDVITQYLPPISLLFTGSTVVADKPNQQISIRTLTVHPEGEAYLNDANREYKWFGGGGSAPEYAESVLFWEDISGGNRRYYVSDNAGRTNSNAAYNPDAAPITVESGGRTLFTLPRIPYIPTAVNHILTPPTLANLAAGTIVELCFTYGATEGDISNNITKTAYGITKVVEGKNVIEMIVGDANQTFLNREGYHIASINTITVDREGNLDKKPANLLPRPKDEYVTFRATKAERRVAYYLTAEGHVLDPNTDNFFIEKGNTLVIGYAVTDDDDRLIPGQGEINTRDIKRNLSAGTVLVERVGTYTSVSDANGANFFVKVVPDANAVGSVEFGLNGGTNFDSTNADYKINIGLQTFKPLIVSRIPNKIINPDPSDPANVEIEPGNLTIEWDRIPYAESHTITIRNGNSSISITEGQTPPAGVTYNIVGDRHSVTIDFGVEAWQQFYGTCQATVTATVPAGYRNSDGAAGTVSAYDAYFVSSMSSTITQNVDFPPAPPTKLEVTLNDDGALVYSWTKADNTYYYVMRGRSNDGINWNWDNVLAINGLLTTNSFTDTTSGFGTNRNHYFKFKVLAYSESLGYSSAWTICPTAEEDATWVPTPPGP